MSKSKFAVGDVVELTGEVWDGYDSGTEIGDTVVVLGHEFAYLSDGAHEEAAYFEDEEGNHWYLDEGDDEPWAAKVVSAE